MSLYQIIPSFVNCSVLINAIKNRFISGCFNVKSLLWGFRRKNIRVRHGHSLSHQLSLCQLAPQKIVLWKTIVIRMPANHVEIFVIRSRSILPTKESDPSKIYLHLTKFYSNILVRVNILTAVSLHIDPTFSLSIRSIYRIFSFTTRKNISSWRLFELKTRDKILSLVLDRNLR